MVKVKFFHSLLLIPLIVMAPQIKIQFRLMPMHSIEDVDPPIIDNAVKDIYGISDFEIYDDRLSDAMYVTLVVEMADTSQNTLDSLKNALLEIPNVESFIVDTSGNQFLLKNLPTMKMIDFFYK